MNCTFKTTPADGRFVHECTVCGRTVTTRTPKARAKCRPRGVGDSLAAMFHTFGVVRKAGCGCDQRQALLNRLIPFSAAAWRHRIAQTASAIVDLPRWLLPSRQPLRVLQLCRTLGTACGIANFAENLHAAARCAGAVIETRPDLPEILSGFDVALIQHENSFYVQRPAELHAAADRLQRAGVPRVLFIHSPCRLDDYADAYVAMCPGMIETARPLHLMPLPANVFPLVDRRELRKKLGLARFRLIVGTHGFCTPPRRYAEFVERVAPVCRELGGALLIAAADHAKAGASHRDARNRLIRAARKFPAHVLLNHAFAPAEHVNLMMQACDLTWCYTDVPSKPYGSAVASDCYGAGVRLVAQDKLQHGAVLHRANVVAGPAKLADFLDLLETEIRRGDFTRHDPQQLSWEAQIVPLLSFLATMKGARK